MPSSRKLAGNDLDEPKAGALTAVIRAAAAHRGQGTDDTSASAVRAGWTGQHLAAAFDTELDVPPAAAV
jgi:hypothetical protein